jgi:hypothetical protein
LYLFILSIAEMNSKIKLVFKKIIVVLNHIKTYVIR